MVIAIFLLVLTYLLIGFLFSIVVYDEFGEISTAIITVFFWPCYLVATILYVITYPIKKCYTKIWEKIIEWNRDRIEKKERSRIYLITKKEYQILRNKVRIAEKRYLISKKVRGENDKITKKAEREYEKLKIRFEHSVYKWNGKIITKNTRGILKR